MPDARRYTDEEFALILRKATEIQERPAGSLAPTKEGLTLEEMQAIAREVGVDPDAVARAASLLPLPTSQAGIEERLFGGSTRAHMEAHVPKVLDEEGASRVVDRIRRMTEHQGRVTEELDAVTWETVDEPSQLYVTLRSYEDGTDVQVRSNRGASFILTWFFTVAAFLVTAGVSGDALAPAGFLGGLAYFLVFLVAGVASARALWTRNTRVFESRLRGLLAGLVEEVEERGD